MNKKNQLIAGIILSGLFTTHGALAQSLSQNLISAEGLGSKAVQSADISEASALSAESFNKLSQMMVDSHDKQEKTVPFSSLSKHNLKWVQHPGEANAYSGRTGDCDSYECVRRHFPPKPFQSKQYEAPEPTGWEGFKNGFHNGWRSVMSFSDVSRDVVLLPKPAIAAVAAGSLLLSAVLLAPSLVSGLVGGVVGALVGTSKNK